MNAPFPCGCCDEMPILASNLFWSEEWRAWICGDYWAPKAHGEKIRRYDDPLPDFGTVKGGKK